MIETTENIEEGFFEEKNFDRIQRYLDEYYSKKAAPPKEPKTSFWAIAGIKTTLFLGSSLGGIGFSAIRTSGYFYSAEYAFLSRFSLGSVFLFVFAFLSLITAAFAFEGYLLADGFEKGERAAKIGSSSWGTWAAILTIGSIGVLTGLELANLSEEFMKNLETIVAIITSIGAIIIAFSGGANMGKAFGEYKETKEKLIKEHQEKFDEWRAKGIASFNSTWRSYEKAAQEAGEASVQTPVQNEQNLNDGIQNSSSFMVSTMNKTDFAYEILASYVQNNEQLPSVRELVKVVKKNGKSISVGTSSNVINEFICENGEDLVWDNIITQERYDEVCSRKE